MNETQFNLRMKQELKDNLELLAKSENRSLNNLICSILESHVSDVKSRVSLCLVNALQNLPSEEKARLAKELTEILKEKDK